MKIFTRVKDKFVKYKKHKTKGDISDPYRSKGRRKTGTAERAYYFYFEQARHTMVRNFKKYMAK